MLQPEPKSSSSKKLVQLPIISTFVVSAEGSFCRWRIVSMVSLASMVDGSRSNKSGINPIPFEFDVEMDCPAQVAKAGRGRVEAQASFLGLSAKP
jgi:hypothetical protein